MDAAGITAVAAANEQMDPLVAAARRRQVVADRPQRAEGHPGLLDGLAAGDLFRLLVLVDQAGDQLQQPGIHPGLQRADTELLDQHHLVALRVVGQDANRIVAHEQLTTDHRPHAAGELPVPQVQAIDPIETTEAMLALGDFDIIRAWLEEFRHPEPLADLVNFGSS
ncbi:hypothetical protein D3C78_1259230 [compost metagenome]